MTKESFDNMMSSCFTKEFSVRWVLYKKTPSLVLYRNEEPGFRVAEITGGKYRVGFIDKGETFYEGEANGNEVENVKTVNAVLHSIWDKWKKDHVDENGVLVF